MTHKKNAKNVRAFFRFKRKQKGTQKKVAQDIGVHKDTIRFIEAGYIKPGRDLMIQLSVYLEAPMEELFPDMFEQYLQKA